jgi:spore coat protein A, manganese oxidase
MPFDTEQYPGRLVFTGPRVVAPATNGRPSRTPSRPCRARFSRVIARFDLPSGTETRRGQKFRYVFHCHILEHEDNDMMRPYDVVG